MCGLLLRTEEIHVPNTSGSGGDGLAFEISGHQRVRGLGGGGAGSETNTVALSGIPGTGGGNGGSGIVIVSYVP